MKDTTGHNEHDGRRRPAGEVPDESLAELLSAYTPKQRNAFIKGFRILADVAIRTHMKRQAGADAGDPAGDDAEEEG